MGSHFLLQRSFPTLGLNPSPLHCRQIHYPLSHQGSQMYMYIDWNMCIYAYICVCVCVYTQVCVACVSLCVCVYVGFPGSSVGKEFFCNAGDTGDMGFIPGSERSPGEVNGSPLHYSCLENPMDRGAWWATVHGVSKSWTRLKELTVHTHAHTHTHTHMYIL